MFTCKNAMKKFIFDVNGTSYYDNSDWIYRVTLEWVWIHAMIDKKQYQLKVLSSSFIK